MNFDSRSAFEGGQDSCVEKLAEQAPLAELQRFRSYSRRKENGQRETWDETIDRVLYSEHLGLKKLGEFTADEMALIDRKQRSREAFGSSRWLWIGGTEWVERPENYAGAFNCSSWEMTGWQAFHDMMNLGMMGCGVGTVVELDNIAQLPVIRNLITVEIIGAFGKAKQPQESTTVDYWRSFGNTSEYREDVRVIVIGDSRLGWCDAYKAVLDIASENSNIMGGIDIIVDISHIRAKGSELKSFGGVANPTQFAVMFKNLERILNKAVGRKLNGLEVCQVLGEGANAVVSGGIRRFAGIKIGSHSDNYFLESKDNLWQPDDDGVWSIDPERDSLRTSNHTIAFHHKPTYEECLESVRKQYYSGEGAIMYVPEAIARANVDLLNTPEKKQEFLDLYANSKGTQVYASGAATGCSIGEDARAYLEHLSGKSVITDEIDHRMLRYAMNPCGEVIGSDFFCNLGSVHLNQHDPQNEYEILESFKASALQVSAYLKRGFHIDRWQRGRDYDPIVLVSFTGAFTFFTQKFGVDWLRWWQEGRPLQWGEINRGPGGQDCRPTDGYKYLSDYFTDEEARLLFDWRRAVDETVWEYCDRHGLKRPNRCTGVKPEGSQTLLTGVGACGWHPPKARYYIRRMTFRRDDPIALAAIDYGYNVVPSQSCKDENGVLLDDPFDPRVYEWLVEVPVKEPWVDMPGAEEIDPAAFPIEAQWDFAMQIQTIYVGHNLSSTLEIYEHEIEPLARLIYEAIQSDEGYISATVLGRFEGAGSGAFPRLPFEPITKEQYESETKSVESRRISDDFQSLLDRHDLGTDEHLQDSACDSGACSIK